MSDIYNKNRIKCKITSTLLPLYTVNTNLTVAIFIYKKHLLLREDTFLKNPLNGKTMMHEI
jgi:hypothetical protein